MGKAPSEEICAYVVACESGHEEGEDEGHGEGDSFSHLLHSLPIAILLVLKVVVISILVGTNLIEQS